MANTPDYSWPPMESRKVIGKSPKRLDGPQKDMAVKRPKPDKCVWLSVVDIRPSHSCKA